MTAVTLVNEISEDLNTLIGLQFAFDIVLSNEIEKNVLSDEMVYYLLNFNSTLFSCIKNIHEVFVEV